MNNQNSTNGISDAHAFAVGQATGVNINGSTMSDAGASLQIVHQHTIFHLKKE